MNATIVYAHPNPLSFNHALLERTTAQLQAAGATTHVRDLYALGFDPLLKPADFQAFQQGAVPADIQAEQDYIRAADWLVFIYPTWWWDRPAILKGYIDRVFSYGFAFGVGPDSAVLPLLTGKKALVLNTFGGPTQTQEQVGNTGNLAAKSMTLGTLALCGIDTVYHPLNGLAGSTPESRAGMLSDVQHLVARTVS
ncbi:MAG: NAD(P)H-dependent oxidoreductase [Hymenobacter sp.]|nr:NAD(P)H-dependent oxidoreductase [Hymenobacter sp.]